MPYDLSQLLVVAISSSALFDNRKEHQIYLTKCLDEYVQYQIDHEDEPFPPGTALPLIRAILRLNQLIKRKRLVEVVILSHMEPEAGIRVMNSVAYYGLDMTRSAFTGGEPVAKYLAAYNVSLFLSRDEADVREALEQGIAAGLLYDPPENADDDLRQLRIAFDCDAVIFSNESELIYQQKGIEAFLEHEKANAEKPLPDGPFALFLRGIARIQSNQEVMEKRGIPPIQTALVTSRNSPAHKRVLKTLRAWGVKIDETFFLGGMAKDQVLKAFRPHIFFDDQEAHAKPASVVVPAARVPSCDATASTKRRPPKKSHPNQIPLPIKPTEKLDPSKEGGSSPTTTGVS